MITPKAYQQMNNLIWQGKIKGEAVEGLSVIIAASNILIQKFNRKGEVEFINQ